MKARAIKFTTADEYFSTLPAGTKKMLKEIRKTIKLAAPDAEEFISYNMPAFKLHGVLVYYAGFKGHISLFPQASGVAAFKKELTTYTTTKGSIHFPLDKPLPLKLIRRIVQFRVKENLEKTIRKQKK